MTINVKWGIISGGTAFILALVTSLTLGHTSLPVALLRGAVFLILFCGMGIGVKALIDIFFPELLNPGAADKDMINNVFSMDSPGSQINITVDDNSGAALPNSDRNAPDSEQIGDFADLSSGGTITLMKDLDQSIENGYTGEDDFSPAFDEGKADGGGDFMDFGAFASDTPGSSDSGIGGMDGIGGAGEIEESDSMMDSFSFFPSDENSGGSLEEAPAPERKVSGNKAAKLEGDFNAKEIAQGLRTVLEKDKK